MLLCCNADTSLHGDTGFGSESRTGPPLGLDVHDIAWYMRFLQDNNFNAIRFLFNHEDVLHNHVLDAPDEEKYGAGAPWESPELENYKYIDMFVKLARVAADHGSERPNAPTTIQSTPFH